MSLGVWGWKLWRILMPPFCVALGVTVGGALLGGFGQWMSGRAAPDYSTLAWRIRIWAVAVAIGGAMTALENLEKEFMMSGVRGVARDLLIVAVAYGGAQAGYFLVRWLTLS